MILSHGLLHSIHISNILWSMLLSYVEMHSLHFWKYLTATVCPVLHNTCIHWDCEFFSVNTLLPKVYWSSLSQNALVFFSVSIQCTVLECLIMWLQCVEQWHCNTWVKRKWQGLLLCIAISKCILLHCCTEWVFFCWIVGFCQRAAVWQRLFLTGEELVGLSAWGASLSVCLVYVYVCLPPHAWFKRHFEAEKEVPLLIQLPSN